MTKISFVFTLYFIILTYKPHQSKIILKLEILKVPTCILF